LVAGLSGNFKREPFGEILSLIPICDRVTKLSSFCKQCSYNKTIKDAHFSYRTAPSDVIVFVGDNDQYIPLCRECFISKCI